MMKNRYKVLYLVFILVFVFSMTNVYASDHRLESLDINVFINSDGSAIIQEHRVTNLVEGTESYIVIDNVGNSEVRDFTVVENGQIFENDNNWNIQGSRESKAGKSGIIRTSSGYELSWGIGDYGRHEYDLEYTVTNFVEQLSDSQMVFWRFVNPDTNIPPERVTVTLGSENEFTEENEKIWGFGFAGDINFREDGKIFAQSNRALSRNDNVTILVKLPDGMFQTAKNRNESFQDILDTALVGSDYDQGVQEDGGFTGSEPRKQNVFLRIFQMISRLGGGLIFVLFAFIFGKSSKSGNKSPAKFTRKYEEEYYRDYPYEGSFLDVYYIPYLMGTGNFENLLTGYILKWINEDRIIAVEEEVGWVFKKDSTNLKFLNTSSLQNPLEDQLFQMMLVAAGSNEILEEKEFTKWARTNYTKIDRWEKEVNEHSKRKLIQLGYLEKTEKKVLFFSIPSYELTPEGREVEGNIYKYINYLNDFSLLNEHEAVNVKIWDNIMIWAGFLGLTAVVVKQFEKLYPNYTQETVYRGNTIFLTHNLARNVSTSKVQAARSSGSGGGTSMGGGGGFSGGGSGGGTR